MLDRIIAFFDDQLRLDNTARDTAGDERAVQLASCALLLEMTRIDNEESSIERDTLIDAMQREFGIGSDDALELMALADESLTQSTDYFQFTSLINRHYTTEQKNRVIEAMWRIAWADSRIDDHERHMLRKIGALLHITHGDHMAAKARAQAHHAKREP